MPETHSIGQPLPRVDAVEKVRGQAIFAADLNLPQMLVGKLLTSPHAHAEILSIDTSKAEALPGVRAVITAADIPEVETYDPDHRSHAFLARQFVVFVGQPVAAVAADDLPIAETALELIEVEHVDWVSQGHQHQVGNVHDIVDGTKTEAEKQFLHLI